MLDLYNNTSFAISQLITKQYSTSFSLAVKLLPSQKQKAIYSIYGFVRLADEIVDTFDCINQQEVLNEFINAYHKALLTGLSTHPAIHAFVLTIKKYNIPKALIDSFLKSMQADLDKPIYHNEEELKTYIYGSADVVGLMCLMVFVDGDEQKFSALNIAAMKLGTAFQKVNFLRDLQNDKKKLGRIYFPEMSNSFLDMQTKAKIEQSIEKDFDDAYTGIKKLPIDVRLSVGLAFFYYKNLLQKIKKTTPQKLLSERVRIHNFKKYYILVKVWVMWKIGLF